MSSDTAPSLPPTIPQVDSRWHKGSHVGAPASRSFRIVAVMEDSRAEDLVVVFAEWVPREGWAYAAMSVKAFRHRVDIGMYKPGPLPRKSR